MKRSILLFTAWLVFGAGCLVLGLWLRVLTAPEWLQPDSNGRLRLWMVEADCYSQMARVQRILQGDGLIQNHFKVENWPEGLVPSTTAPFDYAILLLYAPLRLFTTDALNWAGVLVSPFLWAALVIFWLLLSARSFTRLGRAMLILGSAALPPLMWATAFGRPRHQSLILFLIALGWTAEYERWHMVVTPRRAWSIFAGVVWGLACWTSLFEPVFVLAVLLLFNLAVRRRESPVLLISYGVVMLVALILEGVHVFIPPAAYRVELANWLDTIGEVRSVTLAVMIQRMTVVFFLLPFVAWPLWSRENFTRTDRLIVLLTGSLILFTFLQNRWIYYGALGELFLIVRFFQLAPTRWPQLVVASLFLLGLATGPGEQIELVRRLPPNEPSPELWEIAQSIDKPGGILAPWWLSPPLLYFSGHPIVSGSSHCGISGIVASAKFFSTTSWTEAESILQQRKVSWIVIFDNPIYVYPVLNTSRKILGQPQVGDHDANENVDATVAQTLANDRFVPTWLQLRAVTPQLKLYQYVPVAER